ncbi:hypothetical protein K501DRAFT_273965 [Backusella circina FSU 941]|nr:hypothetical protein K501DRAFT_273965 [Backusella circina FSU 941]
MSAMEAEPFFSKFFEKLEPICDVRTKTYWNRASSVHGSGIFGNGSIDNSERQDLNMVAVLIRLYFHPSSTNPRQIVMASIFQTPLYKWYKFTDLYGAKLTSLDTFDLIKNYHHFIEFTSWTFLCDELSDNIQRDLLIMSTQIQAIFRQLFF